MDRHKKDLPPKLFESHPMLVVSVEILKDNFSSLSTNHVFYSAKQPLDSINSCMI